MKPSLLIVAIAIACTFSCKKSHVTPEPDVPTAQEVIDELTSSLAKADSISNFRDALKDAALTQEDVKDGLTVFAPLNEESSVETSSLKKNTRATDVKIMATPQTASKLILKDHLIKGIFKLADLTDNKSLTALSGKQLKIVRVKDSIWINGVFVGGQEVISNSNEVVYTTKKSLSGTTVDDIAVPTTLAITVYDATAWRQINLKAP